MLVPFFLVLALWIGVEGFIRYYAGKPGAWVVMGMGFGSFFALHYLWLKAWMQSSDWLRMFSEQRNWLHHALAIALGIAVLGVVVFVVAFTKTEGLWKYING
jgi:hypothetical protein